MSESVEDFELEKPYTGAQKVGLVVLVVGTLILVAFGIVRMARTQNHTELAKRFLRSNEKVLTVSGEIKDIKGFVGYKEIDGVRYTGGDVYGTNATVKVDMIITCTTFKRTSDDGPPGCWLKQAQFKDLNGEMISIEIGGMDNFWLMFK